MILGSKALGMKMIYLFTNPKLREEIKKEFKLRKGDYVYEPMLPPGPPPIGEE